MNTVPPRRRQNHRIFQGTRALGKSLPGLAALALLTGLAARPAAAQYLTVGGSGSPPTGGTATISGSGTTASGTYQYLDSGTNPAPLPSATTSYYEVTSYGPSILTLNTGGSATLLNTYNGGTANVLGGSVSTLSNDMNSTVNMSGGSVDQFSNSNSSTATISGGTVNQLNAGNVESASSSTVNVSGGTVAVVTSADDGVANLAGGTFSQLYTNYLGTINLLGTGLSLLETSQSPPFLHSPGSNHFVINGTLQDGTVLVNLPYTDLYPGQDHLNFNGQPAVLTPPTLVSLAFPASVPGGTVVTATVTLNGIYPSGIVVGTGSSDPSIVRINRGVIVPAGVNSATFVINTFRSHVTKTVTITATTGTVVQTQTLTITGR